VSIESLMNSCFEGARDKLEMLLNLNITLQHFNKKNSDLLAKFCVVYL